MVLAFPPPPPSPSFNQCSYTSGPAFSPEQEPLLYPTTGFSLNPTENIPAAWSGRIGAVLSAHKNQPPMRFPSAVECSGSGAAPPATLAEFTLNGAGGLDFYDVSLVDGYKHPYGDRAASGGDASGVAGNCTSPDALRSSTALWRRRRGLEMEWACKSACEAFWGRRSIAVAARFGTPDTCKPSEYSLLIAMLTTTEQVRLPTCAGADYLSSSLSSAKKEGVLEPEAVSYSSASPTLSTVFSVGVLAVGVWVRTTTRLMI
ncbi:hypothetical protein HID58_093891 [Brassica napus]|uniref:Uncharacterized protein n=1 Tax=Brassica napus TaxID=3708 RepID=A0ABQ7X9H3_BRANA|nr:hypothetical protein HID58_093891 [Brassica napus]